MKTPLLLIILLFSLKNYSQCTNVPSNSTSSNLTYTFVGGSFQSYGCAPIDPTYWMAGNGNSVTVTFTTPQDYPRFRVWGMNTDDVASVMVNNASYPMNATTATYLPKVVCGISPGPDGIVFTNGNIVGANTPVQGNYSYSDIELTTTGVTSFKVTGLSGAGWGFASTIVFCEPLSKDEFDWNSNVSFYSNNNILQIEINEELLDSKIAFYDLLGRQIKEFKLVSTSSSHTIDSGIYLIKIEKQGATFSKKVMIN
ncbi:MAG: T9SS type A sorting domain-containing protein [Flavobacteriales bacterium]|nr:T9SS type A sorting domain-containing protein [Flavobacteriales bacterium]